MTKDVLVKIKGMQFLGYEDEPEEPIEMMTGGEYYFRNTGFFCSFNGKVFVFGEGFVIKM